MIYIYTFMMINILYCYLMFKGETRKEKRRKKILLICEHIRIILNIFNDLVQKKIQKKKKELYIYMYVII